MGIALKWAIEEQLGNLNQKPEPSQRAGMPVQPLDWRNRNRS